MQPTTTSALDGGGPWPAGAVKSVVGDVSDFDEVKAAMEGQDAVIHLANGGSDWESNLKYNLIGTYNIFENAALCGVKRVATASRAGVTGQPNDGEGSPCECSSPRSHPLCPQEAAAQTFRAKAPAASGSGYAPPARARRTSARAGGARAPPPAQR